jgi:hypothetical protein|tara:strand:+ start:172 stop:309 length:138 start_codon:yes stop_codon:yes gene_type:complete
MIMKLGFFAALAKRQLRTKVEKRTIFISGLVVEFWECKEKLVVRA